MKYFYFNTCLEKVSSGCNFSSKVFTYRTIFEQNNLIINFRILSFVLHISFNETFKTFRDLLYLSEYISKF